jgi:hypothetical protein
METGPWKSGKLKCAFHFPTAPAAATGGFFFSARASDQEAKIPSGAEQVAEKRRMACEKPEKIRV